MGLVESAGDIGATTFLGGEERGDDDHKESQQPRKSPLQLEMTPDLTLEVEGGPQNREGGSGEGALRVESKSRCSVSRNGRPEEEEKKA